MVGSSLGFIVELRSALKKAEALAIPAGIVEACIDSRRLRVASAEADFRAAFEFSLASIDRKSHARLAPVTGHIAESVAAMLLVESGWTPIEQFVDPMSGGHGIDLAMLSPNQEKVFAVEIKGTLQQRRWPRLSRGEFDQMTPEWLDKNDNPGMAAQGLIAADVSGLVVLIQFHERRWKAAITADFMSALPISGIEQLDDLRWLR